MKVPRDISGERLAKHLCRRWEYTRVTQVGNHIMLRTEIPTGARQVIPAHNPIKVGTLSAILSQVAQHKGVTREDILSDL